MSGPLIKPFSNEVAEFHAAVVALAKWIIADGGTVEEVLDAMEKPWRWEAEANAAQSLDDAFREVSS